MSEFVSGVDPTYWHDRFQWLYIFGQSPTANEAVIYKFDLSRHSFK